MNETTILEPGTDAAESARVEVPIVIEAQEIEPITDEEILILLMAMDL